MSDEVKDPGPLSHSSAGTLLGCEQKYVYYKVDKVKTDPDYEKSDALSIGSAVHQILEESRHEMPKSLTLALKKCEKSPDVYLDRSNFNLVAAMVLKYVRMHKQTGLKVLEVEPGVKSEWFVGYIDALLEDANGKWWIADVKTWKSFQPSKIAEAPLDPQLNLYASFAPELAEMFDLDINRFGGCRWRVVTKTTARQKAGESDKDYVKRLADKNLKAFDVAIPVEIMDPSRRRKDHQDLYWITQELARGDREPKRNLGHCMSYFSPCQYFSKCHGQTFTQAKANTKVEVIEA